MDKLNIRECLCYPMVSEVVVTAFFVILLFFKGFIVVFIFILYVLLWVVVSWLKVTMSLGITWLPLVSKSVLSLTHLIVAVLKHSIFIFSFVVENLFFLSFHLLCLKFINYFLLEFSAQRIFNVVQVKLVLQIVNIGKLLDVDVVETLKLCL